MEILNETELIIICIVLYMVYKQVIVKPVKQLKYISITILLIVGTMLSIYATNESVWNIRMYIFILMGLGIITGTISGMITKLFRSDDGILYQKGGVMAFVFCIIFIPLKFIFRHKLGSLPGNEVLNQGAISYLIVISMQVLVKSIIVIFRVQKFHKELKG